MVIPHPAHCARNVHPHLPLCRNPHGGLNLYMGIPPDAKGDLIGLCPVLDESMQELSTSVHLFTFPFEREPEPVWLVRGESKQEEVVPHRPPRRSRIQVVLTDL